jgi:hypothetical protein
LLLVSFLLVIVATIFLVSGLFLTKDLALIFISIGCSALAGLVLVVAVLRSRPKATDAAPIEAETPGRSPATASGVAAAPPKPPAAAAFPIENYDSLEVVDVLPLLGELSPSALEQVRAREAGGRAHPWVLARIDALLESEEETGEWEAGDLSVTDEWSEPQPEWAETGGDASEWSASDFELETPGEGDYGELEIARDFPIADYESLRATDILPLLSNLDEEDLKLVREVEAGGKARTSILSRIDALLARGIGLPGVSAPARKTSVSKGPSKAAMNLPIADYDSLTVAQITAQLSGLSAADLRALRTYEKRHKARSGVIQKIESALLRAQ